MFILYALCTKMFKYHLFIILFAFGRVAGWTWLKYLISREDCVYRIALNKIEMKCCHLYWNVSFKEPITLGDSSSRIELFHTLKVPKVVNTYEHKSVNLIQICVEWSNILEIQCLVNGCNKQALLFWTISLIFQLQSFHPNCPCSQGCCHVKNC